MGVACNEALQPERRNHLSTRPVRKLRGQTRPDLARPKLSKGPHLIEYLLSNCAFKGTIKFWKTQPDSGYLAGARTKPDRCVLGRHEAKSLLLEDDRPFDRRYARIRLYTSPIIQGGSDKRWSREKMYTVPPPEERR